MTYTESAQDTWDPGRAQHEFKVEASRRKWELEGERQTHQLQQERTANQQRRRQEMVLFYTFVAIFVVAFFTGLLVATLAENDTTRAFGQGVVTLLLGTIAGGLAGYFTGRSGR